MDQAHVDPLFDDLRLQYQLAALATTIGGGKRGPAGQPVAWTMRDFRLPWLEPPPQPVVVAKDEERLTPEETREAFARLFGLYGGVDPKYPQHANGR